MASGGVGKGHGRDGLVKKSWYWSWRKQTTGPGKNLEPWFEPQLKQTKRCFSFIRYFQTVYYWRHCLLATRWQEEAIVAERAWVWTREKPIHCYRAFNPAIFLLLTLTLFSQAWKWTAATLKNECHTQTKNSRNLVRKDNLCCSDREQKVCNSVRQKFQCYQLMGPHD